MRGRAFSILLRRSAGLVNAEGNCFKISEFANGNPSGDKKDVHVYHNTFVGRPQSSGNVQIVSFINEVAHSKLDGFRFKNNIVARDYNDPTRSLFEISGSPSASFLADVSHNVYWIQGVSNPPGQQGINLFVGNPIFKSASIIVAGQVENVGYRIDSASGGVTSTANGNGLHLSESYLDYDIQFQSRPSNPAIGAFEITN